MQLFKLLTADASIAHFQWKDKIEKNLNLCSESLAYKSCFDIEGTHKC